MSSYWDAFREDRERRRRAQRKSERAFDRAMSADLRREDRAAARMGRAELAEKARQERAAGEAEAARRNADLTEVLQRFEQLLREAVRIPARTPDVLRAADPPVPPEPTEPAPPRPDWSHFEPMEPGGWLGRRRYERELAAAHGVFQQALRDHERVLRQAADEQRRRFAARQQQARRDQQARWDEIMAGVERGDPDSVGELTAAVLHAVPPLRGLLTGDQAAYRPEPRELVVQLDLPEPDVIPTSTGWRYARADGVVERERKRSTTEVARRYTDLVSQLTLAAMDALLRALPSELVDIVTANGHVPSTDPATGRAAEPCVITVTADRSSFAELDLGHPKLDPASCLRALGAELSRHPYELAPVLPFVDIDLARYRFAMGPEALTAVDHRTDLLTMDPFDFERLIKDLFDRMGYRAWRTQDSHDDGIDAVAIRDDLLTPVHCVVQVKRSRNRVAPEKIQALMGVLAENPDATNGVLVTTSWFSDRARQRARARRIRTIEGNELVVLLREHLGLDVLIGLPRWGQSS